MIADRLNARRDAEADDRRAFLSWATQARQPLGVGDASEAALGALAAMLGNARIVGLGEAVHGGAEILRFRNRLFRHLVEKQGFTAIAIESGLVEGRLVYDYVRRRRSALEEAVKDGISWTFDRFTENRVLIEWMRAHNERSGRRPVNFYGFDLAGSPGLGRARRGVQTALSEALAFVASVDARAAAHLRRRLDAVLPNLRFDLSRAADDGYERLSAAERDLLTSTVADLLALFAKNGEVYVQRCGRENLAWGHRAALNARDVDLWLRQLPLGWKRTQTPERVSAEIAGFLSGANEIRDRAQAENLEWIIEQEGGDGRVLVFAHRYHVSAAPMRATWAGPREHRVMGTYLRARFGAQLVTIGQCVGGGEVNTGEGTDALQSAPGNSLDRLARQVGDEGYVLDLRRVPAEVTRWLQDWRVLGFGTADAEGGVLEAPVGRAFDLILYQDRVTPA